jgi:hypothetical protein
LSHVALLVVGVQVLLTLLVVAVSIPVMRRLHDSVPSTIRAGVASGVGPVTWLTFVPFALGFGFISERAGIDRAGWPLVLLGVVSAILILLVLPEPAPPIAQPEAMMERTFPADRFLPKDDPEWPGHWATPLPRGARSASGSTVRRPSSRRGRPSPRCRPLCGR